MTGAASNNPVTLPNGRVARFYTWADVQSEYVAVTTGAKRATGTLARLVESWDSDTEFYGGTTAEVREWLRRGYDLPKLPDELPRPASNLSHKPRWRRSDDPEGEFQYDDFLNGETEYYLARDRVGPKPGINVEVTLDFNANVSSRVVAGWAEWVGSALRAIQGQGYDLAVTVYTPARGLYRDEDISETHIVLATFGQQKLTADWSTIWSPAGFRHLMFCACCMADEREGKKAAPGLGSAVPEGWDVKWNGETRTLKLTNGTGDEVPAHELTQKLAELQADTL
jgi:hypothetical protein